MKNFFTGGWIVLLFINLHLKAQDLNFRGAAPSVSVTRVLKNNFDINFLAVSKIRLGNYTVKEIRYGNQVLEIYSQLLLAYKISSVCKKTHYIFILF